MLLLPASRPQPYSISFLFITLTSSVIPHKQTAWDANTNAFLIYLETHFFILALCMSTDIFNDSSFWLDVNVNHQEVASVDSDGGVGV